MKRKVYLSGKITGLKDYRNTFSEAEKKLVAMGDCVMNPATLNEGSPYRSYLPICFAMIDACDTIYMLSNWRNSNGAQLELHYAEMMGKKVVYENELV